MPRTKLAAALERQRTPPPPPPVKRDRTMELLSTYQRRRNVNNEKMSSILGLAPSTFAHKKWRGTGKFQIAELRSCCEALHIPKEEIAEALFADWELEA